MFCTAEVLKIDWDMSVSKYPFVISEQKSENMHCFTSRAERLTLEGIATEIFPKRPCNLTF